MWEPIAKEMTLPWFTVESIYRQVQKRKWEAESFNTRTREGFTSRRQASSGLHSASKEVSQLLPRKQITTTSDSNKIHKRRQQRAAFRNKIEEVELSDDEFYTADDMR